MLLAILTFWGYCVPTKGKNEAGNQFLQKIIDSVTWGLGPPDHSQSCVEQNTTKADSTLRELQGRPGVMIRSLQGIQRRLQ